MYKIIKRIFDILMSLILIVLLAPLMALVFIILLITCHSPCYRSVRIGQYGKPFWIYKFRTMHDRANEATDTFSPEQTDKYLQNYKLKNDPRVTAIGKILRKTSIDELPQLFSIFLGKMSFIGPRPVLYEETLLYGDDRDLFLSVKPGLTGYWQVNGRSNITYESGERLRMELYYAKNHSLKLDALIFFKTFPAVFSMKGAV